MSDKKDIEEEFERYHEFNFDAEEFIYETLGHLSDFYDGKKTSQTEEELKSNIKEFEFTKSQIKKIKLKYNSLYKEYKKLYKKLINRDIEADGEDFVKNYLDLTAKLWCLLNPRED